MYGFPSHPATRASPMPTSFRPYLPDQALLLPSDLREWLTFPP